jgi:hypothetical protein
VIREGISSFEERNRNGKFGDPGQIPKADQLVLFKVSIPKPFTLFKPHHRQESKGTDYAE